MTLTVVLLSVTGAAALVYGILKSLAYITLGSLAVVTYGLVAITWSWIARPDAPAGLLARLVDQVATVEHVVLLAIGAVLGWKTAH